MRAYPLEGHDALRTVKLSLDALVLSVHGHGLVQRLIEQRLSLAVAPDTIKYGVV